MSSVIRFYYWDRLFSQVLRHFLSLFAARILKKPHIHYPYPDSYTNQAFELLFDTSQIIEHNATYGEVLEMQRAQKTLQWCDQTIGKYFRIEDLFSNEHIKIMKNAYIFNKNSLSFDSSALNVAVHIRRGDIERYTTDSRYTRLEFFINTIRQIQSILPSAQIHVYSDSNVQLNLPNIRYHILDYLLETIHDMISADILIMSVGSNMSFFAGLMSNGLVYFDWNKLNDPYNAELNRYWSTHPRFSTPVQFQNGLNELKHKNHK